MREIEIEVGAGLNEEELEGALHLNDGALYEVAHSMLVDHQDDRAEIDDLSIDEVIIDPNFPTQVTVRLSYSWSRYYGCRDMNQAGDEEETVTATYTSEGKLVFLVPSPRRPGNIC